MERGLQPLKVSKPILIVLVLAILFAGYTFFFTGKKRPSPLPSPEVRAPGVAPQASHPATAGETVKPDTSRMNLAWGEDPFFLPKAITDRKAEKPKTVPKLVGIIENKTGRYAIIGGEILQKGDMVGDEKIADIEGDKVLLIRNKAKRVLSIEETGQ